MRRLRSFWIGLVTMPLCVLSLWAEGTESELAVLRAQVAAQEQRIAELERLVRSWALEQDAAAPVVAAAAQEPVRASPPADSVRPLPAIQPEPSLGNRLTWYGYVKLSAAYDSQAVSTGNLGYFVLPAPGSDGRGNFNLTARETRLGLRWNELEENAPGVGVVEIDFYGSSGETVAAPRLRLAYAEAELGGWKVRAGQDWDTLVLFHPRTVNFAIMGSAGHLLGRRPLVRATRAWGDPDSRWTFSAGASRPGDMGSDRPTMEARVLWETKLLGRPAILGASGSWGEESVATASETYRSQALVLGARIPVSDRVRISGMLWAGENLSRWLGGIQQGINPLLGTSIASRGGWLQLEMPLAEKMALALGGGFDDPHNDDLSPGMRAFNRHLSASLFYEISSRWCVSSEYTRLRTEYHSGPTEQSHRLQGAVQLGF